MYLLERRVKGRSSCGSLAEWTVRLNEETLDESAHVVLTRLHKVGGTIEPHAVTPLGNS